MHPLITMGFPNKQKRSHLFIYSMTLVLWPLSFDPFTFDLACLCVISVYCHACCVICLNLESQIHVSSEDQVHASQRQSQYETPTLISAASHRSSLDSGSVSFMTISPTICITVFVIDPHCRLCIHSRTLPRVKLHGWCTQDDEVHQMQLYHSNLTSKAEFNDDIVLVFLLTKITGFFSINYYILCT